MDETQSIRVSKEQYAKLKAVAEKRGVMISWLLSKIIKRYLEGRKP